MLKKLQNTIKKYNMINSGETVCCALSGGADSTALLLALRELSAEMNFTLAAVHINHLLRGSESDRDELFCQNLCGRLNVPLQIFRRDAAAFSRSLGVSAETGAREMRYGIFAELPADKIAAAHNLNDNAETLLFRMARGTGLKGLTGIPPVRGKIIRPLLFCTREEIENFLAEHGQDFVTDSTNLSDDYSRNKIRHKIVPAMSEICGGFPKNVEKLTLSLTEDEDFLTNFAAERKNSDLRTLHPAVKKRAIILHLKERGISVNSQYIEIIEKILQTGGKADLGKFTAAAKNGLLTFYLSKSEKQIIPQIILKEGKYTFSSDKIVIISKVNGEKMNETQFINKNSTTDLLDYDKIKGSIVLRNRLRADKFKPAGSTHTRELRKLLQENFPEEERKYCAVLADGEGVIWSEHFGTADRAVPNENSENLLKIEIKH
ncbi:MAG: tRNA lysidine(34) synthetase TilS [Ruminococcus sp.]|nr:tRNA lysidine(34) synthetase TilS [Ruminococcus sp.]MCM1381108.1 tRNA lysidine(34) synthetase TilS [Muribaculaceae bacterium]MCM1479433.1 tRNA lysidine(34) synthetase TilS [Muribaculaceae bacterium]